MKLLNLFILSSALLLIATSSSAKIYKCKSTSGKIEYSDKPCQGEIQSQSRELSQYSLGPIDSLSKQTVTKLLKQIESALKIRNADKAMSFFTADAKFLLDLPSNMGGKKEFGLNEYKQTLKLGWSIPGEQTVKLENTVITIAEDKQSATVMGISVESLTSNGKLVLQSRANQKMMVVIDNGTPKIKQLQVKLTPDSIIFGKR